MKKSTFILLCVLSLAAIGRLAGQERADRPILLSVSGGYGGGSVFDSYLSPYKYSGWNIRLVGERMRYYKKYNDRLLGHQMLNMEYTKSTYNGGLGLNHLFQVDYTYNSLYKVCAYKGVKLFVGGGGTLLGGAVYNPRNSNNPATAKASIDLNLSAMLAYDFRIGKLPLTARYQITLPVAGAFFTPEYGQSYYEMFVLGNRAGMIHFSSFHNHIAVRNLLTLDLTLGKGALRLGYWNSLNRTTAHGLTSNFISNAFMLGYVCVINTAGLFKY